MSIYTVYSIVALMIILEFVRYIFRPVRNYHCRFDTAGVMGEDNLTNRHLSRSMSEVTNPQGNRLYKKLSTAEPKGNAIFASYVYESLTMC